MKSRLLIVIIAALFTTMLFSCGKGSKPAGEEQKMAPIDRIAADYIVLAFQLNKFDKNYVDNYTGPDSLKAKGEKDSIPLPKIIERADRLIGSLDSVAAKDEDMITRKKFLSAMLRSLRAYAELKNGRKFTFDEECKEIFGVNVPIFQDNYYQKVLIRIDSLLPPAKKTLNERYSLFMENFVVPAEKLDNVFRIAINEGRLRTKQCMDLMQNERFEIEYVTGQSWAAYNWYKGNGYSLIQVNRDIPFTIDKIISLAFHEGYPGHHVHHQLLEQNFMKDKYWVEYSIYPLFSPMSLISEGTANYGIEVIMPHDERIRFEKEVLFPAAGLDTAMVDRFYEINALRNKLNYATNDAARRYLEGKMTKDEAAAWLVKYQLRKEEDAKRYMDFIDTYRAYVINYNYGLDLVKDYVEAHGGKNNKHYQKSLFKKLIGTSVIPQDLKE